MTAPTRILAAVDGSPLSGVAVTAAAALAARLGAVLEGLYVEDINLARLTEHPEVSLVSVLHARRHDNPQPVIAGALKLQRAAAARQFAQAGGTPTGLRCRQGHVAAELAAAAADLLVLGWHGREAGQSLGSIARQMVAGATPLLVARATLPPHPRLVVLAGDPGGLALATALAGAGAVVTLCASHDANPDDLLVLDRIRTLDSLCCSVVLAGPHPADA